LRACVFDAYGTLLDVSSAVTRQAQSVGPRAGELASLWRSKQLEYSWLRSLMRRRVDFWQLTQDALDHSLEALALDPQQLRAPLLDAYRALDPYPEVVPMLQALRQQGTPIAVLSNGSPEMLADGFKAAGLEDLVDPLISVEEAGIFKPAPEAYLLATRALGLPAGTIAFFSSNAWDAHGAASFGFQTVWVNRTGAARDRLPGEIEHEVRDLSGVPQLVRSKQPDAPT
jgi:2-haloacid dehalogenase